MRPILSTNLELSASNPTLFSFTAAAIGREKKCIAGFQPAKVVLTQKELSRLRCRRDAGATIFSHDRSRREGLEWKPCFRICATERAPSGNNRVSLWLRFSLSE